MRRETQCPLENHPCRKHLAYFVQMTFKGAVTDVDFEGQGEKKIAFLVYSCSVSEITSHAVGFTSELLASHSHNMHCRKSLTVNFAA